MYIELKEEGQSVLINLNAARCISKWGEKDILFLYDLGQKQKHTCESAAERDKLYEKIRSLVLVQPLKISL